MPAMAQTKSRNPPQSTPVVLPWPTMKSAWSATGALRTSVGMEAAKVSRYSTPPASASLRVWSMDRMSVPFLWELRDRDQRNAEVAQLLEHAVQCRLVDDRTV